MLPLRIYLEVSSKDGFVTVNVTHQPAAQSLILPVFPSDSVPEAAPFLEPAFAHYVGQWPKIMVPDPDDTFTRGFYLEPSQVPDRIADPDNNLELTEICWRHLPESYREFFRSRTPRALAEIDSNVIESFDECMSAAEAGIEPYLG